MGLLHLQQEVQKGPSVVDVGLVSKFAWYYSAGFLRRICVEIQWCGDTFSTFYDIHKYKIYDQPNLGNEQIKCSWQQLGLSRFFLYELSTTHKESIN